MSSALPALGPIIRLERATLGYSAGAAVLRDVSLDVRPGDFLAIVGPNGSGKTTILRTVLGLLRPLAGEMRRRPGARLGYVPQRQVLDAIYPLRALDVVLMGLYGELGFLRRPGAAERARALAALEACGMAAAADRLFRDLSGGQQQRVLVARALVSEPDVLVLDEPTNDLDLAGERGIMDLVAGLHRAGRTVLLVSHMLNVVASYALRLALIEEGTLLAGPIDEMLTPARLEALYGMRVAVGEVAGRRVVVPSFDSGPAAPRSG